MTKRSAGTTCARLIACFREYKMIDPLVRDDVRGFLSFLEGLPGPKLNELSPGEARVLAQSVYSQVEVEIGTVQTLSDLEIDTPGGHLLRARLFDARTERVPSPVLVFMGWPAPFPRHRI